jgi:hypothetical protein
MAGFGKDQCHNSMPWTTGNRNTSGVTHRGQFIGDR